MKIIILIRIGQQMVLLYFKPVLFSLYRIITFSSDPKVLQIDDMKI
jgi:hypothetical protein